MLERERERERDGMGKKLKKMEFQKGLERRRIGECCSSRLFLGK